MNKQDEIREGLRCELAQVVEKFELVTQVVLDYLHSQGCVLKVERELPYIPLRKNREITSALIDYKRKIEEAGYCAVEDL